ncbi:MAG: tetratricopeptide repeat protein [Deferribacteres bacterium]|nr:tetratricopeptide repeat protein [Deferribacteres bacterium]
MKDKTSIINAAQKFTARGQIDEAIAEWSKLLASGKDGNIHNTIGDLYLKKRAQKEAIESFTKAADIFREDGFYPKAIALYKKILNLDPNRTDAVISLAELNAERGFTTQATEDLLKVANKLEAGGDIKKALEVYQTTLRFSPFDINIKIKIAELSLKLGLNERAAKGFTVIASDYLEKGDTGKAEAFYQKAIGIDPGNITALTGLSTIAEKAGNLEQALEYLSKVISSVPDDRNILLNYSNLAIKANKTDGARDVLLKLVEKDPSDNEVKKLLGALYINEGEIDDAWEALLPCIDEAIESQKWAYALELLNPFMEIRSIPVRQRLVSIYRGKGDNEVLLVELKELAELHESQGALEEAVQSYKEALELSADDSGIQEKIHELQAKLGTAPSPGEAPAAGKDTVPPGAPEPEPSRQDSGEMSSEYFAAKKTEADFYAQQGLKDEAVRIYEELLSAFPGNSDIENELNALKSPTPAQEGTEAIHEKPQPGGPSVNAAMNEILKELDEEPASGATDYEKHFQAGITYRRQGLLDEAVRELRIAAGDPARTIRNSRMLALCYMEKGSYAEAVKEFEKVIAELSPDSAGYLDILYETAEAYVSNGDNANALRIYTDIHSQDPTFRDVAARLDELGAQEPVVEPQAPPEAEHHAGPAPAGPAPAATKPKPKKNRISYL